MFLKRRKLTGDDVLKIREMFNKERISAQEIAKKYNVSIITIYNIINSVYYSEYKSEDGKGTKK